MIEIRPIREFEADTFLHLLCGVFGLDYGRASHVFFHEPLYELGRKWAAFDGKEMISILTTSPLEFGWGRAIGIAGVATRADRRGEGLASLLLTKALSEASKNGEEAAFLFANFPEIYERSGFKVVDHVIRAPIRCSLYYEEPPYLAEADVRKMYDHWSHQNPNRLRRDDKRWKLWQFNMRRGVPLLGGYSCAEGNLLRECVPFRAGASWPLERGTEWFGLESVAKSVGVPLGESKRELLVMSRSVPSAPQMFMTDQF
jgi:N-acetylglutamate synthase-like GNAT family acetyltransferase